MAELTPATLRDILIAHEQFHQRLKMGEYEDSEEGSERFEKELTEQNLRPFIESVGPRGIVDLLHLVHEAIVVILNDIEMQPDELALRTDQTQEEKELHDYISFKVAAFMSWATMSMLSGRFDPMQDGPELPLGERQSW